MSLQILGQTDDAATHEASHLSISWLCVDTWVQFGAQLLRDGPQFFSDGFQLLKAMDMSESV
jgi:hypothetical protein